MRDWLLSWGEHKMSDVFISYAREDRKKAKALAELFQQQDWSVWWDRNIPPGHPFHEVIEAALGTARRSSATTRR